jgi:hypothetical protein
LPCPFVETRLPGQGGGGGGGGGGFIGLIGEDGGVVLDEGGIISAAGGLAGEGTGDGGVGEVLFSGGFDGSHGGVTGNVTYFNSSLPPSDYLIEGGAGGGGGGAGGSVVPEPSTWVMLLLGFAGLGFAGYRTSRRAAAAA